MTASPRHLAAALTALSLFAAAGCRVDSHKDGNNDNVKIATPFGGMSVKTNDSVNAASLGLPDYPGAQIIKKDKDNGAADVNMSFGTFQLRVKAISFRTPDSADKVEAFYRKALGRYGTVIQCVNEHPVGEPSHTEEGLTCENQKQAHITVDESSKKELKAGSRQHQHIVSIDPEGSGTKFGVVVLDLPGHMTVGDEKESQ